MIVRINTPWHAYVYNIRHTSWVSDAVEQSRLDSVERAIERARKEQTQPGPFSIGAIVDSLRLAGFSVSEWHPDITRWLE